MANNVQKRVVSELVRDKWYLLWPNEITFLKQLASSLGPAPTVFNIGAGKGTSGLAFMEARDDMNLITVDIAVKNQAGDGLQAEAEAFRLAGFPGPFQTCRQIMGDSYTIGMEFDRSIQADLVFIDGDHSYNAVKDDIDAWLPRIKEGGIIAFHDYKNWEVVGYEGMYGPTKAKNVVDGVARAVDEKIVNNSKLVTIGRVDTIIAFKVG